MSYKHMTVIKIALLMFCLLIMPASASSTKLSSAELERILAPIALFPDSLLGNILTAAGSPDEVIAADAWIAEHADLAPDKVMKECESQPWDPSVKALLLVPETLEKMCNNMTWTQEIGNAFVDQNTEVMDTVQKLRKRAKDAGNLKDSKDVQIITDSHGTISIGTSDPNVIVVPRYSPTVVYEKSSSDMTMAIVWGCVFVADIIYESCVWDWWNHRYWYGPGYNHCRYWGDRFYPWGTRCHIPPPLHPDGPPPPPHHPRHHHPDHHDNPPPHHPDHHGPPPPPKDHNGHLVPKDHHDRPDDHKPPQEHHSSVQMDDNARGHLGEKPVVKPHDVENKDHREIKSAQNRQHDSDRPLIKSHQSAQTSKNRSARHGFDSPSRHSGSRQSHNRAGRHHMSLYSNGDYPKTSGQIGTGYPSSRSQYNVVNSRPSTSSSSVSRRPSSFGTFRSASRSDSGSKRSRRH